MKHFPIILAGVVLNTLGQLCLKAGMIRVGEVQFSMRKFPYLFLCIAKNPFIELGVICYILSLGFWLWTLSKVDVSTAYPMLSIGYVLSLFAGYFWFNEPVGLTKILGIIVIMLGVYLVAQS